MKKTLLSILGLLCFMIMQAQVPKTVNMTQAGTLADVLTSDEKYTITDLTLTGPIDARDFKTMRDRMHKLAVLDMEGANIEAYSGNNGTNPYSTAYPANEIPSNAFHPNYIFNEQLKEVKMPAGVTSIGNSAFLDCLGLTRELKLPAGLTKIGECAFQGCRNLAGELKLPAGVTSIGNQAFQNCYGLKGELILPDGISSIGSYTFQNCRNFVGELKLPASLTTIGECAFQECDGFTGELILPAGVSCIKNQAFKSCYGLTNIRSYAQIPPEVDNSTFEYTSIKIAFVPQGSKSAYQSANFWKNLVIIDEETHHTLHISTPGTLRETIESAGGDPNCVGSLTLTGELNKDDFALINKMPLFHTINMEGLSNVSIPAGTFYHKSTLSNVIFPAGLTSIEDFAFYHCNSLAGELILPEGLTTIGNSAFHFCNQLTGKLKIPAGVTTIGGSAFSDCYRLTGELILPDGLTTISNYAFNNCIGLTGELKLPADLTSIGQNTFSGCIGLTGIEFSAGLTSIGNAAFENCKGLTCVLNLPASVMTIGSSAFSGCSGLTSIHIKENVKSIAQFAFSDCSNVSKITCDAVTPPSLGPDIFKGINTETCELYVVKGSATQYQNAPQWDAFKNIIETDNPTGIISPDKTIRTWKANGQLVVESTEEMSAAEVVDMSGRTACFISKTAYAYVLNLPSNGVYVVRIRTVNGEVKTVKVAM